MRVCERVFSVAFGPGLDSISPARSGRSASHGWLPQKTVWPGLRRGGGGRWIQFAQQPRAVFVWCFADYLTPSSNLAGTAACTLLR